MNGRIQNLPSAWHLEPKTGALQWTSMFEFAKISDCELRVGRGVIPGRVRTYLR